MTQDNSPNVLAARERDLIAEGKNVTGKISENCRFIGFGLLAAFYAVYTDTAFDKLLAESWWSWLLLISVGTSGGCAIFLDYLQFLCGHFSVKQAKKDPDRQYRKSHWAHKWRKNLFWAKQAPIFIGCLSLILFIFST